MMYGVTSTWCCKWFPRTQLMDKSMCLFTNIYTTSEDMSVAHIDWVTWLNLMRPCSRGKSMSLLCAMPCMQIVGKLEMVLNCFRLLWLVCLSIVNRCIMVHIVMIWCHAVCDAKAAWAIGDNCQCGNPCATCLHYCHMLNCKCTLVTCLSISAINERVHVATTKLV